MAMKEDRAREGKKAQYRKMGFGPMMKSGEIDFGDKHPLLKAKKEKQKKYQNPKKDERFNAAFRSRMKKAGLKDSEIGDTRLKIGGLTGGQAKLDKNKNNKIDAQDFKILRAEKAKGRGQGLQDEKMKPGKTMAAKKGGMFKGYSKVFETAAKAGQKNTGTSTIVGVKPKLAEASKKSKIARRALRAAKATRLGKMVLPIAAAGVAAQQYLKSKMKKKKEEPKKKMGGGMMQKYAEGGDAKRSPIAEQARRMRQRKPKPGPLGRAGRGVGKSAGPKAGIPSLPGKAKKNKPMVVIVGDNKKYSTGQGGIERDANNNPYRYSYDADPQLKNFDVKYANKSIGGSVTVKTKLGRNKPTKMY